MARIKYYNPTTNKWEYAETGGIEPVQSVNGQTGAVSLSASDVGAEKAGTALLKADVLTKKAQLTLADGTTVLIDVFVAAEGTAVSKYTNQIPISKDSSGEVFNGTGWKGGIRISGSSGTEKEQSDAAAVGYIPVKAGDVIRMAYEGTGATWDENGTASSSNCIAYYDADYTWLGSATAQPSVYGICTNADAPTGSILNGGIVSATVPNNTSIAFMRMSSVAWNNDLDGMILTINEEIT